MAGSLFSASLLFACTTICASIPADRPFVEKRLAEMQKSMLRKSKPHVSFAATSADSPTLPDNETRVDMTNFEKQSVFDEAQKRLFQNYQRDSRPLPACSMPHCKHDIKVQMGLNLEKLVELDQLEGTLTMVVWLRLKWPDFRLAYKSSEFGISDWNSSSDFIAVDFNRIWTPDIFLFNSVKEIDYLHTDTTRAYWYDQAKLEKEGYNMVLTRPAIITSRCPVNLKRFPFDKQTCHLQWGTWSSTTKFSQFVTENHEIVDDMAGNEEFKVIHVEANSLAQSFSTVSGAAFPEIDIEITAQRYSLWYVVVIIFPLVFILYFSNFIFFIDIRGGKRHSVCVTLILTVMAARLLIAERLPASNEEMWLTRFQSGVLQFMLVCGIESVVANYIDQWNDRKGFDGDCLDLFFQLTYPIAVMIFMMSMLNDVDLIRGGDLDATSRGPVWHVCFALLIVDVFTFSMGLHNLFTFTRSPRYKKNGSDTRVTKFIAWLTSSAEPQGDKGLQQDDA